MILSADPGISGALALYDWRTSFVQTWASPVEPTGPDGRNRVDVAALAALVSCLAMAEPVVAALELTNGRGGQDAAASYQFGRAAGILEGLVVAAGIPVQWISPSAWKPRLGVPSDKKRSRERASQLLPHAAHLWRRQTDHGHAEAAMIGYYAAHVLGLDGCVGAPAARPRVKFTARTFAALA